MNKTVEEKRAMIEREDTQLNISQQCELLGLHRSVFYYQPAPESQQNLDLMAVIDGLYLKYPFYGTRRMTVVLQEKGYKVNRKRIRRLYQMMGLEAIGPKPSLSHPAKGHKIYPYLLRNLEITKANQVWATDLTYLPMPTGFMYLMAVIDLYSRKVITWGISNSMDTDFCCRVVTEALQTGKPTIFNPAWSARIRAVSLPAKLLQIPSKSTTFKLAWMEKVGLLTISLWRDFGVRSNMNTFIYRDQRTVSNFI